MLAIRDEMLAPYPRTEADMRRHLADYYATITHLDEEFGRVMAMLRERGMADNTIIVFSSDQGLAVGGYHALMGKQNFYEDVKPPLVLCGPGIPQGSSAALVYLHDLYPTLLELAGIPVPAATEGRSLLPIVQGRAVRWRDTLFGAYANRHRMIRDDRWKLYKFNVGGVKHSRLFDLSKDPEELHDLSADPAHAATLARLDRALLEARRDLGDPVDFDSAQPELRAERRKSRRRSHSRRTHLP